MTRTEEFDKSGTAQTELGLQIQDEPKVVLEYAEWWDPNSRLAVVKLSIDDGMRDLGLRLDLDKRAFLDSLDDSRLDEAVGNRASSISRSVVEARDGMTAGSRPS